MPSPGRWGGGGAGGERGGDTSALVLAEAAATPAASTEKQHMESRHPAAWVGAAAETRSHSTPPHTTHRHHTLTRHWVDEPSSVANDDDVVIVGGFEACTWAGALPTAVGPIQGRTQSPQPELRHAPPPLPSTNARKLKKHAAPSTATAAAAAAVRTLAPDAQRAGAHALALGVGPHGPGDEGVVLDGVLVQPLEVVRLHTHRRVRAGRGGG